MKKILISAAIFALASCSKTDKKDAESSPGVFSGARSMQKVGSALEDINKNTEKLKTVTPLTNDEIKAPLPENLLGMKRASLSAGTGSAMQISSASATYTDGANKNLEVTITDGAGETGSAMLSLINMALAADSEKTTETGFEKIAPVNGTKMIMKQEKDGESLNSEVTCVLKNRYTVSLKGTGFTAEELAAAMKDLNVSTLK